VVGWLISHVLNGLSFGALLFLLASGLTLTFGLLRSVNLAHGGFYLLGGYLGLDLAQRFGSYWLGLLFAVIAVGFVGLAVERGLLHRLRGQELPQIVLTIGVAFVISDQILAHYGGRPRTPPRPPGLEGVLTMGEVIFPWFRLALIAVALAVWAGFWLLLQRTRLGAMTRAAVDDGEMARGVGIPVPRVLGAMFALGAALAAFAGVWGGAFLGLAPGGEFNVLLLSLVVVVVGGLGSVNGALVGAGLVGLVNEFGRALFPELALFTIYAPVALLLAFRAQGLFGAAAR
jgi:branched-chain amino acid transport system permease protein